MGLLDGILGSVLGGVARGGLGRGGLGRSSGGGLGGVATAAIIGLALQLLQRNGGIEGVLGKLRQQGHAKEADSWVGTGQNMPVSPDVLSQIFGRDQVASAAQQMGVDPDAAMGGLADVFPEVVNQMTPQGRVESGSDDLVARALEELQQRGHS
ncbi:MAG TPA: YidB family protein [Casimicrobiaceae bacterium]|nr:YidB family protein [Casimicrobiaceae bacterium]